MVFMQGHQKAKKGCVTLTCNHSVKRARNLNEQGEIVIKEEGLKDWHVIFVQGTARATSSSIYNFELQAHMPFPLHATYVNVGLLIK